MSIRSFVGKFMNKKPLVKVYSHPRSGTHFLEAFLTKNFYQKNNLSIDQIVWGHWSNRLVKEEGNPYGKLFGNHYFGYENDNDASKIYIYRDGRAVAYSMWKTPNFIHEKDADLSFNEFLNYKLDWSGSPARRTEPEHTVFEHWVEHVNSWKELLLSDPNLLIIRYEDLVDKPYEVYEKIHFKFFKKHPKLEPDQIDAIKKPLGLMPNKGLKSAWVNEIDETHISAYKKLLLENSLQYGNE